jgi:hypothetical protein
LNGKLQTAKAKKPRPQLDDDERVALRTLSYVE